MQDQDIENSDGSAIEEGRGYTLHTDKKNNKLKNGVIASVIAIAALALFYAIAFTIYPMHIIPYAHASGQYFNGKYYLLLNKSTNGSFTINVWIYYTKFNGTGVAVSDGIGDNEHSIWYIGSGGEIGPKTACGVFSDERVGNYTAGWRFASTGFIGLNKWYDIACVYNKSSIALYINGNFVNSTQTPYNVFGGRIIEIGKRTSTFYVDNSPTFANFFGYIKNLQVYSYSLDANEIRLLYNNYLPLNGVSIYVPLSGDNNYTCIEGNRLCNLERINSSG